jgi:hypothetical protein
LKPAFMLRLLFQSIEQSLGQSLSQVSWLFYCGGLTLLVFVILVPVWRIRMQYLTARTGMEQRWVMTCGHCGRQTLVSGRKCGTCENDLGIPWMVRLWTAFTRKGEGPFVRRLKWGVHLLGSAAFLLLSVWIVTATGSLAPQGSLHRLFLGLAFVALAVFGWLGGRALGIRQHGLLARAGDAMIALAAIGAMAVALFLADSARPQREISLVRFDTSANAARIGEQVLLLPEGEIGVEYLQLDQENLGYHRIIPLTLSGREGISFQRNALKQWVISHLRKHAAGYTARGLTVRLRTDRLRITPGQSYEVVEREGQVLMRNVADR